jgi:hypothetical protein
MPVLAGPLQCRMQMSPRSPTGGGPPTYSGTWDCVRHLLRTEGARGLTRGVGATMARETPGNALFFTVYEVSWPACEVPAWGVLAALSPGLSAQGLPSPWHHPNEHVKLASL